MGDELGGEDALWQDLIARLTAPAQAQAEPAPWPAREELPALPDTADAEEHPGGPPDAPPGRASGAGQWPAEPPVAPGRDLIPGVMPSPPQVRIVRPAAPTTRPPDDEEEHFIPPPPPPLPRLDSVSKAAWLALFGGPGYLLLAILLGWVLPGWAAFCAVAAFVGGFATLVVRLGDRPPPQDSGPDDGAVV